jgi:CheY-like chemotaxis protein
VEAYKFKTKSVCHIVFVDDEKSAIKLFEHSLKAQVQSGEVKLLCFSSGQECLDYLKVNEVEVMLMFSDINMPNMDGFSLLDKLKVYYPHLDLFFISAYDREDFKSKASMMGAKGYLTKPVNFSAIKSIIKGYLE